MGRPNEISNLKKHVWVLKLKRVLLAVSIYLAVIFLIAKLIVTADFETLLKINFTSKYYIGFLIPNTIFYILFEEVAFRNPLKKTRLNLSLAITLLLVLSVHQFPEAQASFYLFSVYGLFLLVHLNKPTMNPILKYTNMALSFCALSLFHLLKFDLNQTPFFEQMTHYVLPILGLAILLSYLRIKYTIATSLLSYLILHILILYIIE